MSITQTEFIQGPVTPGGQPLTSADIGAGSVGTTQLAASAVGTTQLATGAVTNAKLGSAAVTKAKMALFISTEQTGTGSAQNIAHGLGVAPANVFVSFTGTTSAQAVTEGSHTTTNVVVTVTTGATFKVLAIA